MYGCMDGWIKNRTENPGQYKVIYLLKYLLNAYFMPGIVLGTGDTKVNKQKVF